MGITNFDEIVANKVTAPIEASTGSIGTAEIADSAITTAKIASEAVTTAKIAAEGVTPEKLSKGATAGTATAGAATANGRRVRITTESLTTASGSTYTLTLTNSSVSASSIVRVQAIDGTNTDGGLLLKSSTPGSGSVVLVFVNVSGSSANGTFVIDIMVD